MKSQNKFFITLGVLAIILGIAWVSFSTRNQVSTEIFPATVNRDCAPWDGAAFTISFRYDPITTITISIWQSPDIKFPSTFSFPNKTEQVGYAYILPELDPLQQLSGEVFFWHVEQGIPVEGEFNLVTEAGQRLKGKFIAEWENEIVYCG